MIRLGLIGCGEMGKTHVDSIRTLEGRATLAAFVDPDVDRAKALAARHPGSVAAGDYREIISAVDAVILATPHDLHYEMGVAFLKAGKHVLMEKPLALTEAECDALVAMDHSPDPVLMVGYVMRHDPLWSRFGEYVKSRKFGDMFQLSIWTEQLTDVTRGAWLGDAKRLGGGQLFSHGCHYIDLMLDWMGEPVSGCHVGTNLGTPWMEREGTSNVTIKFANNALGYHMGTWGARGSRHGYAVHAHCTQGMLELDNRRRIIILHRDASGGDQGAMTDEMRRISPSEIVLDDQANTPHKPIPQQLDAFVRCIERREKPLVDASLARRSLRVIWRLYEAEDKGTLADLRGL